MNKEKNVTSDEDKLINVCISSQSLEATNIPDKKL